VFDRAAGGVLRVLRLCGCAVGVLFAGYKGVESHLLRVSGHHNLHCCRDLVTCLPYHFLAVTAIIPQKGHCTASQSALKG
jgi:hypothetical protein